MKNYLNNIHSIIYTLTKYLRKITGGKIEASRKPNWGFQVFAAVNQDSAIAGEVRRVDGAIGYVQTSFARRNNLRIAQIENRAGRYVEPTLKETEKALANIKFNDDFTTEDIIDPEDGYPLVSLSWLLFYKKYDNEAIVQENRNLTNNDISARADRDISLHFELSYRYPLTDRISITPGFLIITNPEHNAGNDTIWIGLMRTSFTF